MAEVITGDVQTHVNLDVLEEENLKSVICFPASGKHTEVFRQSRAGGHTLLPFDIW